ncbi:hypothetical protein GCM10027265_19780 [Jatrophihabitans fulvus]
MPGTVAEPRSSRRTTVLRTVGLAAAAAAVTGACAAGQLAQTAYEKPSIDGNNASVGVIDLRGIALEAPEGKASYAKGSSIPMTLVIVNNGRATDTLTGVRTAAASGWGAYPKSAASESSSSAAAPSFSDGETGVVGAPSSGAGSNGGAPEGGRQSVKILSLRRASFGVPDSNSDLLLTGTTRTLYPGSTIKVTFTFAKAGTVTVSVPVQIGERPEEPAVAPGSEGEGGE